MLIVEIFSNLITKCPLKTPSGLIQYNTFLQSMITQLENYEYIEHSTEFPSSKAEHLINLLEVHIGLPWSEIKIRLYGKEREHVSNS